MTSHKVELIGPVDSEASERSHKAALNKTCNRKMTQTLLRLGDRNSDAKHDPTDKKKTLREKVRNKNQGKDTISKEDGAGVNPDLIERHKKEFVRLVMEEGQGSLIYHGELPESMIPEHQLASYKKGLRGDEVDVSYHSFSVCVEGCRFPMIQRFRLRMADI